MDKQSAWNHESLNPTEITNRTVLSSIFWTLGKTTLRDSLVNLQYKIIQKCIS